MDIGYGFLGEAQGGYCEGKQEMKRRGRRGIIMIRGYDKEKMGR